MPSIINLVGLTFGRLTVISFAGKTKQNKSIWLCKCSCGLSKTATASNLKCGNTRSCGCLQSESALLHQPLARAALIKHGYSGTRLSEIFKNMVQRCYNENADAYKDYGGRGIIICDEWLCDRARFFKWALANGYKDGLSIDRENGEKGYSPSNCRWATAKQQARNTRRNRIISFMGESACISEWAEKLGLPMKSLWYRINAGWDIGRALTTPIRRTRKL